MGVHKIIPNNWERCSIPKAKSRIMHQNPSHTYAHDLIRKERKKERYLRQLKNEKCTCT